MRVALLASVVTAAFAITTGHAIAAGPVVTTASATTTAAVQKTRPPRAPRVRPNRAAKAPRSTAATNTPQEAVQHFLQPRSPADACAQLSKQYAKRLARRYGPCLNAVTANPKVKDLVFSHVSVHGKQATLKATYRVSTRLFAAYFGLTMVKRVWLISGAH